MVGKASFPFSFTCSLRASRYSASDQVMSASVQPARKWLGAMEKKPSFWVPEAL